MTKFSTGSAHRGVLLLARNIYKIFGAAGRSDAGHDLPHHLLPRAHGDDGHARLRRGLFASIAFLITKNFKYDAVAVAVTEVGPRLPGRRTW